MSHNSLEEYLLSIDKVYTCYPMSDYSDNFKPLCEFSAKIVDKFVVIELNNITQENVNYIANLYENSRIFEDYKSAKEHCEWLNFMHRNRI